jgi:streptomycin 3"-adenylyltransferase
MLLRVATTIQTLQELIIRERPGSPVAVYLTGSYCDGGLRPDSDLDILLITSMPLQIGERRILVEHLLAYSGRRATRQPGRPIELTSLVLDDIKPWRYPAMRDFLYGEWLRSDYEAGHLPRREADPNLPVILTSARQHSSVLMGPPLTELTDPVPREHLTQSMFDALPSLLDDLVGDERNVLLTLARILFSLRTGLIAPKDVAAADACSILATHHAHTLDLAARAYRGEVRDDWTKLLSEASAAAKALTDRIYALRP